MENGPAAENGEPAAAFTGILVGIFWVLFTFGGELLTDDHAPCEYGWTGLGYNQSCPSGDGMSGAAAAPCTCTPFGPPPPPAGGACTALVPTIVAGMYTVQFGGASATLQCNYGFTPLDGTQVTCTNNFWSQVGTCVQAGWVLQDTIGTSCDVSCSATGRSCVSGDWGVHNEASMGMALAAAAADATAVCQDDSHGAYLRIGATSVPEICGNLRRHPSSEGWICGAGYNSTCIYGPAGHASPCSATASFRLCRCV